MRSDLHKQLQDKAENYLLNKGYWICGQEVPMPVGICDTWGMSRSLPDYESMGIEVKVSRTDFRSKSQRYKEMSNYPIGNYQYVLCPQGLIQPDECHHEWGLLWWNGSKIINKKKAPRIDVTAQQKLDILIFFLVNGNNPNRPQFPLMPDQKKMEFFGQEDLGILNK